MKTFTHDERMKFVRWVLPSDWLDDIVEWLVDEYDPEDLYGKERLREWAFEHGLIDPEDVEPE